MDPPPAGPFLTNYLETVSTVPRGRPSSSMEVRVVLEKPSHGTTIEELKNYRNGRITQENGLDKRRIEVDDDEKDKRKEKKWTLGGFFRRKGKKEADDSSEEEEDGKRGFLSRRRSSARKRKSSANGFDVVVSPHALETVGKTAEELWTAPQESQQRYIFRHHDVRAESNLSRNSGGGSGSLDGRKGRREVMARAQAKRDQMRDGSSSEDNESGASTSSVTKEGRRRRVGKPKVPSATPSPSRSPRVQPKHPLHASSSYPLPVHTYPPGYHWDVGAFAQHGRTPNEYDHYLSTCGTRNKSLSCDQDMHRAEAMFIQLPIARTRSSSIRVETHGEVPNLKPEPPPRAYPATSRFDSTSSLPVQPQSLIKRSSSGNSFIYMYENVQDSYQPRASSYQHIYQNYRAPNGVTKATAQYSQACPNSGYYWGANPQKMGIPSQNELRYYADQNPRSRNPIHITCGNTNPSPTGDPSCLSDSQISRRSTKEFWRQKDKEVMMQNFSQQQRGLQPKDGRSRSNSPVTSGITHKPKSKQTAVVITRKVAHAVPNHVETLGVGLPPPGHSEDIMRVKTPPEPPLRRRSKLETSASPPTCETPEKSTTNLDDALNELETIYKSLRLAEEHGTPLKKKPSTPKSPDIVADDMAKRRLNSKEPLDQNKKLVHQSYLQCSPALSGTPGYSPVLLNPASPSEPDITLDDVVFRNIRHANSKLKTPDPQPPFGIPIGPVTPAAQSDYLHINPAEKFRSSFVASKMPDVVKDDLAFRNLRKDGLTTNLPVVNYNGKGCTKKRAVRSLSENLFNLLQKDSNAFLPIETNNNVIDNDFDKTQSMTDLNENIKRDNDVLEQRLKALKEEKLNKRAEFFEENLKPALPTGTELRRSCSNADSRQKSTSTETLTEETEMRKNKENYHKKVGNTSSVDSKLQPPPAPERRHFRSPVVELSKYPAAVPATALYANPFKEEPTMDDSQLDDLLSTIAREAKITSEAIGRQLVELEVAAATDMLSPDRKSKTKLSKLSAELTPLKVKSVEASHSSSTKQEATNRFQSSPSKTASEAKTVNRKSNSVSPGKTEASSKNDLKTKEDVSSLVQRLEEKTKGKGSSSPPKVSFVSNLSQILLEVEKEHLELSKKIGKEIKEPLEMASGFENAPSLSQILSRAAESRDTAKGVIINPIVEETSKPLCENELVLSPLEKRLLQAEAQGLVAREVEQKEFKRVAEPRSSEGNVAVLKPEALRSQQGESKEIVIPAVEERKSNRSSQLSGDGRGVHHPIAERRNLQRTSESPGNEKSKEKNEQVEKYCGSSSTVNGPQPLSSFLSDVTVVQTKMEEVPSTAVVVTLLNPSTPEDEGNFEPISDFSEIMDSEEQEEFPSAASRVDVFEKVYEYNCSIRNVSAPKPPQCEEADDVQVNEEVKRILASRIRGDQNGVDGRRGMHYTPRGDDSNLPRGVSPRGQGDGSGGDMSGVRRNGESSSNGTSPNSTDADRARERMERYKEKRRQELSAKYGPRAGSSGETAQRPLRQGREKTESPAAAAGVSKKTDATTEARLSSGRESVEREAGSSPTAWGVRETKASRLRAASRTTMKPEPDKAMPSPGRKDSADKSSMRKSLLNRQPEPTSTGVSSIRKKSGSHSASASPTMNGHTATRDQPTANNSTIDRRPLLNNIAKRPSLEERCQSPRTKKPQDSAVEDRGPTTRAKKSPDPTFEDRGPPTRTKKPINSYLEDRGPSPRIPTPLDSGLEDRGPTTSTKKPINCDLEDRGPSPRTQTPLDSGLENRGPIPRTKKLSEPAVAEPLEQPLVKPSILKKKSVEEPPSINGASPRPVSILKRKTLSQDGAVTFSPSVVEKEQNRKKQGILKKRRSLDESEVARRRSSSPDKSILKNVRRSSMEELTSILKRDSSENVAVLEQPPGILKRKSSTPTPAVQQHVTIAESVIMAAAAALNDFVPIDGVRPILKKKSSSEEHTPESYSTEQPRPILKKKSVEVEDVPFVRPASILKSSRKSSAEELLVVPILKRSEGGDADEDSLVRRLRSSSSRERARSAPPLRPTSAAGRDNVETFLQRESQRSPPPPRNGSAEDYSPPSLSSGDAEVFVGEPAVAADQEEAAAIVVLEENQVPLSSEMEKSNEGRSSAVSRFRDRKLRDNNRFHTQPISAEVVEAAVLNRTAEPASGNEDAAEDELSKLSLSERVRLFNSRIQEAGAGPPMPPSGRRPRSARFKTQPVTDEERNLAQTLRSGSSQSEAKPQPAADSATSVPLIVRRGILKQATAARGSEAANEEPVHSVSNGVTPVLTLKLPSGRNHANVVPAHRTSEGPNLAKLLQTVNKEAAALIQAKNSSSLVKSQSHSAVSSVLRKSSKTVLPSEDVPPSSEGEKMEGVDVIGGLRRSTTQPLRQLHQDNDEEDLSGLSIKERLAKLRKSGEVGWQKRKMKMKTQDEVSVITTGNYLFNGFGAPDSPSILASRLDQLDTARESWKSRVPQTDAVQFTVEGKMGCLTSKSVTSTPTNGERTKRSPKQVRFRSRNFAPLLQSTPASPQPGPTLTRSLSLPTSEEPPPELSPPAMLGPSVPIPRADDETFTSFFQSLTPIPDNERLELKDDDLDALHRTETKLLVHKRTVQVQRRRRTTRNPVKSLAMRSDLQEEYIEIKTGVAERELRRMKIEKLSRGTSLAVEALAGLASNEDFTAVSLRKPVASPVQYPGIMLLRVKGRRHVQTRLVEPSPASVNKGDCFLLVTRDLAAMYHGELSNVVERARAKDVAARIEAGDLACGAGRVSNEGRFWAELGGEPLEAGPPDEDEKMEAALNATNMIYELVDHELVPVSAAWGTVPKVEILDPFKNLVFDFGSEMYVWSGKSAPLSGRREAFNLAKELWEEGYDYSECEASPVGPQQGSERPPWALFCKVTQNMEPILFKEKFQDWPDEALLNRSLGFSEVDGSTLMEIQPCDASRMVKEHPPWPDLELEGTHLGRGVSWFDSDTRRWSEVSNVKVSVWRVTEYEHSEVHDERSLAQFYDNGSYVIRWHYSVSVNVRGLNGEPSKHVTTPGRDRYAYFLWQGRHSTPGDRGAAAVLTVTLDEENAPQIVVPQLAEPPAFLQLFDGVMTVHHRTAPSASSLYLVRGVEAGETMLLEVEVTTKSLRSRGCFLLLDRDSPAVTLWCGCRVSKSYKEMTEDSIRKVLKIRPPEYRLPDLDQLTTEEEGSESSQTLATLGGSRDDYHSLLESSDTSYNTPRLFYFASTSGEFSVTEVSSPLLHPDVTSPYPFLQSDLYLVSQPALFLLDSGDKLWVWQGWVEEDSSPSAVVRYQAEKRAALQTALDYWERTRGGAVPMKGSLVWAGLEPTAFIGLFPFWEVREDVQERNLKEAQRSVGEVVDLETELLRLSCNRYPLDVLLQRPLPDGVDPTNLEDYLEPKAFPDLFEMSKQDFMELPPWKRTSLKKEAGLF